MGQAHLVTAFPSQPTRPFGPRWNRGAPPPLIPHRRAARRPNPVDRRRVGGGGGARGLVLEVRVPIWGIGSGGAHHGRPAAVQQVGGGELVTACRRRGWGRRLGVRGATVSSGGGRCGGGGARRWPEVALDGKAASTNDGGVWLGASTGPCGGQWLCGRLGMAQRHARAVHGGQRSATVAGRGGNGLLLQTDHERIRRMGWQLHALRVEGGRQVVRVGTAAGAVGT
jgi:hypothetical protein